jgi:rod shape-determining protein MreC
VLIALLIVAIALITVDFRDGGDSSAHSLGGRLFGPVERVAGDVTGWFTDNNSAEVTALQQQNDQLRAQLAQAQSADTDGAQLASLLHLSAKAHVKVVPATVIAAGGAYSDTVTINAGSGSGIATNETVLNGDGLVGTVVSVTSSTATVQLASDAGTTVGVRTADTRQIGAVTGTADAFSGSAPLKLTLFDSTAVLSVGEEIVTFGSLGGSPYVPGIPVGTVTTVTTEPGSLTPTAYVQPYVDFTGLGVVGVVISK